MPKVLNKRTDTIPRGAIYIGRGSRWGNPYRIGLHGTRAEVIELYRTRVLPNLDLAPLRDKDLVCYCAPAPCHGDLLVKAANKRKLPT